MFPRGVKVLVKVPRGQNDDTRKMFQDLPLMSTKGGRLTNKTPLADTYTVLRVLRTLQRPSTTNRGYLRVHLKPQDEASMVEQDTDESQPTPSRQLKFGWNPKHIAKVQTLTTT